MPYNPTATFVATIRTVINGEPGSADTFNRPTEDLDSRTLYLKAQRDAHASSIGSLQSAVTALQNYDANLSAEMIGWPGTDHISTGQAANVAEAIELAATLGGGGGGANVVIRTGVTSLSGATVVHNIGNIDHATAVTISTQAPITAEQAAGIGEFYVVRGANEDVVYTTGNVAGVMFDFIASENPGSGTVNSGSATFSASTGTVITHNIGNVNHRFVVSISDTSLQSADAVASVGAVYIVRGAMTDTVYNTGTNNTLKFDYIIS